MATYATTANVTPTGGASATLAASGSRTATLDLKAKLGAWIQVKDICGGTIQASSTVTVSVYPMVDDTNAASVAITSASIAAVASATVRLPLWLAGGTKYTITCVNSDTANAHTLEILAETVDSFG